MTDEQLDGQGRSRREYDKGLAELATFIGSIDARLNHILWQMKFNSSLWKYIKSKEAKN